MSRKPRLVSPLEPKHLHTTWPEERIPWEDSNAIPRNGRRKPAQPRALQALELALEIRTEGFNVFLSGEAELGRTYMLKNFLLPKARKEHTPPDLLYVNNFEDPDKPLLLRVPAGQGKLIKSALGKALQQIRKEVPSRFEATPYVKKRGELLNRFHDSRSKLLDQMDNVAGDHGFNLDVDEQGSLTLYPLVEGKCLSDEEYENLDSGQRNILKRKSDALLQTMTGLARKLSQVERDFKFEEKDLDLEVIGQVLDRYLTPVAERACRAASNNGCSPEDKEILARYFEQWRADILEHSDFVFHREPQFQPSGLDQLLGPQGEPDLTRYDVNVFVDNSQTRGAPIITDNNPTFTHLLGCVEREAEMGALVTDFTLIKAGSLHRANGGYLIVHIEDVLHNHGAWEGLMRSLRTGQLRIEENPDGPDTARTKGIEPDPLPLDLKVFLVGEEGVYESLLMHDERFGKLFKIKAQMTSQTLRNADGVRAWLHNLAPIIDETGLLPFRRDALARLVDFSSGLCEDQRKLSLKFPIIRDVMIEASAQARMDGTSFVDRAVLDKSLRGREYRDNLVEELFMEEYDRDMIKIRTSGEEVGRVNGLSVTYSGEFEFGLPHQISCTVGVGHGGIIDLEREAELGGPIHTKAMMILKSYLADMFSQDKPLVLNGSLCFEQSYSGIEGDSASGAELAALLSAISGVPLRLSLAFTGAVSQSGQIMAVGGATRKIEGFFHLCARRGLTGEQGVIMPKDNVDQLMLESRVVDAVREGKFHIYPVTHITEALELLTGMGVGKRRKNGTFAPDTLFGMVDDRLHELGWLAEHCYKVRRKKRKS